jgi:hypothetical protein
MDLRLEPDEEKVWRERFFFVHDLLRFLWGTVAPRRPLVYPRPFTGCYPLAVAQSNGQVAKTQMVRRFDVVILGPAMIVAATRLRNPTLKLLIGGSGVGTILYNLANYRAQQRLLKNRQL